MTAVAATPGVRIILIDPSLDTATIPSGTWNLDNCILFSQFSGDNTATLNVAIGATLTFRALRLEGILLESQATSSPITIGSGTGAALFLSSALLTADAGAAPLIHVAAGSVAFTLSLDGNASELGDGTHPVLQVDSGAGSVQIQLKNNAVLDANSLTGAGAVTVAYQDSVTIGSPVGGAATLLPLSTAPQVAYSPSTPGNWSPAPSQVAAALDQLATRGGFAAGGDLFGGPTIQQVVGLQGVGLPSPSAGFLRYTGAALQWTTPILSMSGDCNGNSNANQVTGVHCDTVTGIAFTADHYLVLPVAGVNYYVPLMTIGGG
jgi:hypothetical protein